MSSVIDLFEDDHFKNQKRKVFDALRREPMTMLELASFTNIMRANICRYIAEMEDKGTIQLIRKRRCTISGYPFVGEYSANPDLFREDNQLKLFG